MRIDLREISYEILDIAEELGWELKEKHVASTDSIYLEMCRREGEDLKEWIVIRVADHKQIYHHWLRTYSCSPYELGSDDVREILEREFGEAGDVL